MNDINVRTYDSEMFQEKDIIGRMEEDIKNLEQKLENKKKLIKLLKENPSMCQILDLFFNS